MTLRSPSPLTRALLNAWAALHGEYWLLWTLHWRSRGASHYGDHLLYQRLYEARQGELDRLAEVAAAVGGAAVLDPVRGMDAARPLVEQVEALDRPDAAKAVVAAQTVMGTLDAVSRAARGTPYALSVDNAVGGIADAHLEAIYLLQQRLSGVLSPLPAAPPAYKPFGGLLPAAPPASYAPRSDAGRLMAGALRYAGGEGSPAGVPDAAGVLGAAGDLLSLVPGVQAAQTAGAVGKGLAVGAGVVAALMVWRKIDGGR